LLYHLRIGTGHSTAGTIARKCCDGG